MVSTLEELLILKIYAKHATFKMKVLVGSLTGFFKNYAAVCFPVKIMTRKVEKYQREMGCADGTIFHQLLFGTFQLLQSKFCQSIRQQQKSI